MLDPCKSVYCFMAYTQNASWFLEIAGSTGKPNNVEKIKYSFIGRTVILNLQQLWFTWHTTDMFPIHFTSVTSWETNSLGGNFKAAEHLLVNWSCEPCNASSSAEHRSCLVSIIVSCQPLRAGRPLASRINQQRKTSKTLLQETSQTT